MNEGTKKGVKSGMSRNHKWKDISYLALGNPIQQQAYAVLRELAILENLQPYDPIMVGTIPIDIHIESSDIDLICEVHDFEEFEQRVIQSYQQHDHFQVVKRTVQGIPRIKVNFSYRGMEIELFGQPIPTMEQNGFRHMVVEHRLLTIAGERTKAEIIRLKREGQKTEPAFASFFQLKGDPYEALLKLYPMSDEELKEIMR